MTRTPAIAPITGPATDLLLESPLPLSTVPSPLGVLGAGPAPEVLVPPLDLDLVGPGPLVVLWVGSSEVAGDGFGSLVGRVGVSVETVVVVMMTGTVDVVVVGRVAGGAEGVVMTGVLPVGNDIVMAK